jgi:hypothetical protein
MEEQSKKTVQEEVVDAIERGRVCMRPRWQFILRGVLAALGGVLIALALLYVISLILFMAKQSGLAVAPLIGWKGMLTFMRALPWLLITLSLAFIVLLEVLVRRYSFAYRRPLLVSALGIITLVFVGGFLVAQTSFHRRVFRGARDHKLLFIERVYRAGGMPPPGVYRGFIDATTTQGFYLRAVDGGRMPIGITSETRLPRDWSPKLDTPVIIFGLPASDTVQAVGVKVISRKELPTSDEYPSSAPHPPKIIY